MAATQVHNGWIYTQDAPGQPWRKTGQAQQQQIIPANPAKVQAAELGNIGAQLQNQRTAVQMQGDATNARVNSATEAARITKARADAKRAQIDADARASEITFARAHNGLNRQQWNEAQSGLEQVQGLNRTIGDLRNQYNKNFKGKGVGSLAEYLPAMARPANGVFDNTALSLLADLAKAKGLTSQQFNTPAEQKMFFEPLLPNRNDTDEEIASKINALQRMTNDGTSRYARQLGMRTRPARPNQGAQQQPSGFKFLGFE